MSKERPRLSRLGVLAPAALSACIDASVLAAPAAGAIVATVLKELSKAFMLKKWFHGVMTAQQAEQLLMGRGRNGSYLVRESQTQPGEYVLSVRVRGRVTHVLIRREQNKYDVGSGEHFDDLVGLIEHFRAYPMIEASGDVLRLMQPVSGSATSRENLATESIPIVKEVVNPNDQRSLELRNILEHQSRFSTCIGARDKNMHKNRYRDVIPYDQTRVILPDEDGRGNYINASHIRPSKVLHRMCCVNEDMFSVEPNVGPKTKPQVCRTVSDEALIEIARTSKLENPHGLVLSTQKVVPDKCYIATQGCLSNTIEDFWLMIYTEGVNIIVMLTQDDESGQKCERYWPHVGTTESHRGVTVKTVCEYSQGHYIIREFEVSSPKMKHRKVYQYQFEGWPDHKIPSETYSIISFMEDINQHMLEILTEPNPPEKNILCVHCSAGIGRTGTFIVIDMLMDIIKEEGLQYEVDILSTVQLVRAQRPGMVQNKAQFKYIYEVLKDYIAIEEERLKENKERNKENKKDETHVVYTSAA